MKTDFDEIYQLHWREVFRYLRRQTGSRVEAEDILQETFLKLHVYLASEPAMSAISNLRAWLFRVATNLVRDRRRNKIRALQREEKHTLLPGVVDFHLKLERQQLVRRALQQLSPQMRQVLLLANEGFSYREISSITGIATTYVGVLLQRGRAAFKEHYQKQHERKHATNDG